jgi:hypothetical protein
MTTTMRFCSWHVAAALIEYFPGRFMRLVMTGLGKMDGNFVHFKWTPVVALGYAVSITVHMALNHALF